MSSSDGGQKLESDQTETLPSPRASDLAVIVPVYNPGPELRVCLRSVREYCRSARLIVVDDCSPAGYPSWVSQENLADEVVGTERNGGFGAACNRGAARAESARWLLLLNQDAVLLSDVQPTLELLNDNVGIAVAGGLMKGTSGQDRSSVLRFPILRSILLNRHGFVSLESVKKDMDATGSAAVDYVEGSFMVIRGSAWRAVGGMDERYFMYGEERDLSARLASRRLGRTVWFPGTVFEHEGGFHPTRRPWVVAGQRRFIETHRRGLRRLTLLTALRIKALVVLVINSVRRVVGKADEQAVMTARQVVQAAMRGDGR